MNENELDKCFAKELIPKPSAEAKRAAIQAAMAEFSAAQSEKKSTSPQGKSIFARLTIGINNVIANRRKAVMNILNQKVIVGGLATSCAVLLGFLMLQPEERGVTLGINDSIIDNTQVYYDVGALPIEGMAARQDKGAMESEAMEEVAAHGARSAASKEAKAKREFPISALSKADMSDAPLSTPLAAAPSLAHERMRPKIQSMPANSDSYAVDRNESVRESVRDQFQTVDESPLKLVQNEPVSTFSIDVDTASYSFVRRQINQGRLPQKAAVRVEEMLNYFDYDYPVPKDKSVPFTTSVMITDSPWGQQAESAGKKLIHIGIKGYDIKSLQSPKTNLVFLLDVSGSMNSPDKLPLVKQSMQLLLSKLQPNDTVAIAVYAGAAGTILEPTPVKEAQKIIAALNALSAGGSTAGAQGIQLAYQLAEANFNKNAINRVILATDGDFNVGISDVSVLQGFVERKREKGIYLSVLGFGEGNYNDQIMQTLAQNGNGVAAYIDTLSEAQKVLVHEATSALFPIAKDVKIQVEFNPNTVAEYRLVGYETRQLNTEDFNNDAVDAGDIGAGHTVTAIYEITPVDSNAQLIDERRYADNKPQSLAKFNEYGFVKLRYKLPNESDSKLISMPILMNKKEVHGNLLQEAEFATAVAGFAQLLKGGKYTGELTYDDVITMAQNNKGADEYGYRTEFVQLVRRAAIAGEL